MAQATPYRVTDEDLAELKSDVREGMQPLLGALNVTLGDLVRITGAAPSDEIRQVSLVTQTDVADAFPLTFTTSVKKPRFVSMNCVPEDEAHSLATPFVMQGFAMTEAGLISIPAITGLLPDNEYALTFWIRG